MRETWIKLTTSYPADAGLIDELWTEIETAYTAPHRHYHNLAHLTYMKDKAIRYRHRLDNFNVILFSIFYHDAVYNSIRKDNEEKSAEMAGDRLLKLGVPTDQITRCRNQIVATKTHEISKTPDTNYLVDFDLAILGDTPETYAEYAEKIRAEYSIYPKILYNKGRKKVLQHFLEMDRIFKTDDFHSVYEEQARKNLSAELKDL